jgi:aminoglycoside phosphotransferase (APT) family kinase protein
MTGQIEWLQSKSPALCSAVGIEPIHKGFSSDRKYLVRMESGERRVLRIADQSRWERKRSEFHTLHALQPFGASIPQPIECGIAEDLQICYILLSHIDGEDARDILPLCTEEEQFCIGWQAGQDLRNLHQLHAPSDIPAWHSRAVQKHARYLESYRTAGLAIPHDEKIMAFVEENKAYLRKRPNRFQHDDFHVGNLITKDKQYAGAIDFDRYDWGDPIHDFYKLALFSREVSVPFCFGQICGYFYPNEIPPAFWTLYTVYVAMSLFSAVVWTVRVAPDQLQEMLIRVRLIAEDHLYFERVEPVWFSADRDKWESVARSLCQH